MTISPPNAPPGWEDILDADESILWQGAPDSKIRFTGNLGQSLFGLFFGGFALFWMGAAAMLGRETGIIGMVFPLFGLPFLLVGLYMVFGRFLWGAYVRRGTFYTLTNKRAYIATSTRGKRKLASYEIHREAPLELIQGPPDSVYFNQPSARSQKGAVPQKIGFEYIDDGRRVLSLLRQIQKEAP